MRHIEMDIYLLNRFLFIRILFVFSLMLTGQLALANSGYENTKNQWLIGVGGGGVFRSLPSSTRVSNGTAVPAPYNYDIFSIHTSDHAGTFALFGGYQWNCLPFFIPYSSLTLHYEHQFRSNITGNVQQYALPEFTNYKYSMTLNSDMLDVTGKIGLIKYKFLLPYFSAGIGVAFNHVDSYSESPIAPVNPARISPSYGRNKNTNFAYTLGTGVDIVCNKNTSLSLAYEYWNLGKVNSGSGVGSWSSTRLNFGTLKSHTLLTAVTYFF